PRSLIANLLAGPPSLASLHLGRDGSIINHMSMGVNEGASALRSLSPLSTSVNLRASYLSTRSPRPDHPAVAAGRAMAGSGYLLCLLSLSVIIN
ncbi:autophagy-related protein 9A, partial [Tachysurus ichikawai]